MGQTGGVAKRWRRGRDDEETGGGKRARPARTERSERPDDEERPTSPPAGDDLASRLGPVASTYAKPPTADELRAAFSRKKVVDTPPPKSADSFESKYSAESLFSASEEPAEQEFFFSEDRSRTTGDYYYDPDDAWGVLGLQPGAAWKEITAAHRRMAMKHHPDRLVGAAPDKQAAAEETMREINVAYSVLRRLTGH